MKTSALILMAMLLSALCGAVALYYRLRVGILRRKLQDAQRGSAELGSFMNLFSRNIRNMRDTATWMNLTARYVADTVNASCVCIFTQRGDTFRLSGASGNVPRIMRTLQLRMLRQKSLRSQSGGQQEPDDRALALLETASQLRESLFIDDPSDRRLQDLDPYGQIRTLMGVPMVEDGEALGLICAINNSRDERKSFDQDQFGRLKFLSGQVVLAENMMRVYANLTEQQRIAQELEFARSLQRSLLPQSIPVWGRFMIYAVTRASKEVSGDFYDFVEIDEDRLLVVIGDACGKGIPACLIMAMTRSFIRSNVSRFSGMKDMLAELNGDLFRDMGDGRYITLGAVLLNRRESTMNYARAGHTELLVYIHKHIRSFYPDGTGLGLLPGDIAEFDTFCMEFEPGMEILLFTDGINEATDPEGHEFSVERLKEIFAKSCLDRDQPRDTIARIMGAVDDFSQKPESQADDQTLVIIRQE